MNCNHAKEVVTSRFSLQQVSASTRKAMGVDTGCQRCQHCMLRRLWPQAFASTSTPIVAQSVPKVCSEETGSHLCKQ
jgi:hypothetical protein